MREALAKGRADATGSPPTRKSTRDVDTSKSTPTVKPDADLTADQAGNPDEGMVDAEAEAPEKTIPESAFKKRIARESTLRREAQGERDSARLEAARYKASLEMVYDEYEQLKAHVLGGGALDAKDEQLRSYHLKEAAREASAQLLKEHQEALLQQSEKAEIQRVQADLREEMRSALDAHPLLTFPELKAAMVRAGTTDSAAVAATLQAQKLEMAERLRPSAAPRATAPRSAKPGVAAGTGHRFSRDQKGMSEFLASARQSSGR